METAFFTENVARDMPQVNSGCWRILRFTSLVHVALATFSVFLVGGAALAQELRVADLPDAPVSKSEAGDAPQAVQKGGVSSTVRLLSRRSLFFPELAYQTGPLSPGQKFELAVGESVAPSRFVGSAVIAGIDQATNTPSGYGQGGEGYGKRFGATMASSASESVFGTFLLPSIFRQDPRYFVRPHATFKQRVGYALRRVVVTRTDRGGEAFNVSGLLGTMMAEGLANAYLPDAERTAGRTFQRVGIRIGIVAAGDILKEYWPNIFKSLGMKSFAQSSRNQTDATNPGK